MLKVNTLFKTLLCGVLISATVLGSGVLMDGQSTLIFPVTSITVNAAKAASPLAVSHEYGLSTYYTAATKVMTKWLTTSTSNMTRVLQLAKSQINYKNRYVTASIAGTLSKQGYLWSGLSDNATWNSTGVTGGLAGDQNTEYTRWFHSFVLNDGKKYVNESWCAEFASWCLYQAGYGRSDPKKYYSMCADPRQDPTSGKTTAFWFNQNLVEYTATAEKKFKISSTYGAKNRNISPYNLTYTPGALVFFNWNGTGDYFNHVGIVVSYDKSTHVLTYISGNDKGAVRQRKMDLDVTEAYLGSKKIKNANRIMAVARY